VINHTNIVITHTWRFGAAELGALCKDRWCPTQGAGHHITTHTLPPHYNGPIK